MNSLVVFNFTDDPDWRAAINSITYTIDSISYIGNIINRFQIDVGTLFQYPGYAYGMNGTWEWTIKATGYEDTLVTVIVQ